MPRALKILVGVLIVAAAAAVVLAVQFTRFLDAPIDVPEDGVEFEIRSGTAFRQVADDLGARGIIADPLMFRAYARLSGEAGNIQGSSKGRPGTIKGKLQGNKVVTVVILLHRHFPGRADGLLGHHGDRRRVRAVGDVLRDATQHFRFELDVVR